ncbi:MAG: orotate phosphoribosyltransferase [Candidatus Promineifilaceae bacterium]
MPPARELDAMAVAVIVALHDIGAVRFGDFKLHSGRHSPIYLDLRLLTSYPAVLRQVAAVYAAILETISFDLLAAMPLAGLPIGTAVSLQTDRPLVYPRQALKSYGTGKQIEGIWSPGQRVAAIDDLITSGDSLLQGIAALEEAGLQVSDAVVLIDRQQGGRRALQQRGYTLHSAFTLGQMLVILEQAGRISAQQQAQVTQTLG